MIDELSILRAQVAILERQVKALKEAVGLLSALPEPDVHGWGPPPGTARKKDEEDEME